jgi:hypothetical protein
MLVRRNQMAERMDYDSATPAGVEALNGVYDYIMHSRLPKTLVDRFFLRFSTTPVEIPKPRRYGKYSRNVLENFVPRCQQRARLSKQGIGCSLCSTESRRRRSIEVRCKVDDRTHLQEPEIAESL